MLMADLLSDRVVEAESDPDDGVNEHWHQQGKKKRDHLGPDGLVLG